MAKWGSLCCLHYNILPCWQQSLGEIELIGPAQAEVRFGLIWFGLGLGLGVGLAW